MKNKRIEQNIQYIIVAVLLFAMLPIMSCSNKDTKPATHNRPGYYGEHFGSPFEQFITMLRALPEDKRQAAVLEYQLAHPHTPVIESDSIVSIYYFGNADAVIFNSDLHFG